MKKKKIYFMNEMKKYLGSILDVLEDYKMIWREKRNVWDEKNLEVHVGMMVMLIKEIRKIQKQVGDE